MRLKKYAGSLRTASGAEYWCLPGGGLDEGEPLISGIEREMIEETGVRPVVGNLLYVQQFAHKDKEYLEFFFHITNGEDYVHIDLTQTTHGAKEIEEAAFIDPAAMHVMPEFLATERLEDQAKNGIPKIISRL